MFFETVAIARDIAIILLALQAFVVCLVVLLVSWKTTSGLRAFVPRFDAFLKRTQMTFSRVTDGVDRAMQIVRAPFEWLNRTADQARAIVDDFRTKLARR